MIPIVSMSFSLSLFAPSSLRASAPAVEHRTLSQLHAVHANSVPGPFTTRPDGSILFVAEAGVVAVIDATDQGSYEEPEKIVPISSQGVRALELALDPEIGDAE